MTGSTVKVRGKGQASGVPSHGVVTIEIKESSSTGETAFEGIIERCTRLEALLKELGIPDDAVESSSLKIQDQSRYSGQDSEPMEARNSLRVKVPSADLAGRLITGAVREAGAEVNGPVWELNSDSDLHKDALRRAGQDAKLKAESLAEALGVRLGPVIGISDPETRADSYLSNEQELGHFALADADYAPALHIYEGHVHVEATIDVTFAIA